MSAAGFNPAAKCEMSTIDIQQRIMANNQLFFNLPDFIENAKNDFAPRFDNHPKVRYPLFHFRYPLESPFPPRFLGMGRLHHRCTIAKSPHMGLAHQKEPSMKKRYYSVIFLLLIGLIASLRGTGCARIRCARTGG